MGDDDKPTIRRQKLKALAARNGWNDARGITQIAEMLGRQPGGIEHDLTEGFAREWLPKLRTIIGDEYLEEDWARSRRSKTAQIIPIRGSNTAADQLLLGDISHFVCIRAPSMRPRLSKSEALKLNQDGLVNFEQLAKANPPAAYLRNIWDRVKRGLVSGVTINAMGRIGALPEVWATTDLIRRYGRHDKISVYLLPSKILLHDIEMGKAFFPMFGARVVNKERTLLSMPLNDQRRSTYSPIIVDQLLAGTVLSHSERLISFSDELTAYGLSDELEDVMKKEYEALSSIGNTSTQYGRLDTFEKLRKTKDIIVEYSLSSELWLPPLA